MLIIPVIIWLFLILFWGKFWLANQVIDSSATTINNYPTVAIVIPARNEATLLPITLTSLLSQEYPGDYHVILVDDQSDDGTSEIAQEIATNLQQLDKFHTLQGQQLPSGWTGKLWALQQGITFAMNSFNPTYILLTDADIQHHSSNLQELVNKAIQEKQDLVSLMVSLRCESFWEKLLIPAFVFFFEKLYPFPWVNNPQRKTAAAAGGCILVSRQALDSIGGIEVIRKALIDDCALAMAVKSHGYKIWLGLSQNTKSLRPYDTISSIWEMVARTAYTQLNYSCVLLLGTVLGMTVVYLLTPIGLLMSIIRGDSIGIILGLSAWGLMILAYSPTLRLYGLSPLWGLGLPAIALLYTAMTIDSALRYWRGKGGVWKGRISQVSIIEKK